MILEAARVANAIIHPEVTREFDTVWVSEARLSEAKNSALHWLGRLFESANAAG